MKERADRVKSPTSLQLEQERQGDETKVMLGLTAAQKYILSRWRDAAFKDTVFVPLKSKGQRKL